MAASYPPGEPPNPPLMPPAWTPPPPPAPPVQALEPLPWEQPGYPFLEALYETAKLFVVRPSETFARMSLTAGLDRPVFFAIVLGWLGIIAQQLYQIAFGQSLWRLLPGFERQAEIALPAVWAFVTMVIAPLLVILAIFIWSAILHLFLLLTGGATAGFAATVRVVCYAGTTQILQVVPFCGGVIGGIWAIILEIVGLAIVHRTTQARAALAVLLPIALCCVCAVITVVAFGAAIAAALAGLR
jgi:hypothetical protein